MTFQNPETPRLRRTAARSHLRERQQPALARHSAGPRISQIFGSAPMSTFSSSADAPWALAVGDCVLGAILVAGHLGGCAALSRGRIPPTSFGGPSVQADAQGTPDLAL